MIKHRLQWPYCISGIALKEVLALKHIKRPHGHNKKHNILPQPHSMVQTMMLILSLHKSEQEAILSWTKTTPAKPEKPKSKKKPQTAYNVRTTAAKKNQQEVNNTESVF